MGGDVTLCFYIVVGISVAVAVWIRDTSPHRRSRVFRASTAVVFWPMYLPLLLVVNRPLASDADGLAIGNSPQDHNSDELAVAISEAETDLDRALQSLDHWPDVASFVEVDRFADLRLAWNRKASEIRELDRLLAISENQTKPTRTESPLAISAPNPTAESHDTDVDSATGDRIASSEKSRRENLTELNLIRLQWHGDLLASLAQVRQFVTQIHLARYTGKPASRAAELVQQIAHTVASLDPGAKRSVIDRQPLPDMAARRAQ